MEPLKKYRKEEVGDLIYWKYGMNQTARLGDQVNRLLDNLI